MKKLTFSALFFLLLLAVAAPICLAAEKGTGDQQPFTQYNKLPPLQFFGSSLTQKKDFQAALWSAQQNASQSHSSLEPLVASKANPSVKESTFFLDLSVDKLDAKIFWPSVGVLVAAILTFLGTLYTNRITLKKTKIELEHLESVRSREQCKEYCIEFLDKLDTLSLAEGVYEYTRIRYLLTALAVFTPANYSNFALKLSAYLRSNPILIGPRDRFPPGSEEKIQYEATLDAFTSMYTFLVLHTKIMLEGKDLNKHLKKKGVYVSGGVPPQFFD